MYRLKFQGGNHEKISVRKEFFSGTILNRENTTSTINSVALSSCKPTDVKTYTKKFSKENKQNRYLFYYFVKNSKLLRVQQICQDQQIILLQLKKN